MNWLIDLNWLAGPLLQITLLVFMIRREVHAVFTRFFSHIAFQILKSACLFVVYRYFPEGYFDAYWTGNALSVIFAVAVMDEILRSLFREYGGVQILGTTIFRWSCGLLFLLLMLLCRIFKNCARQQIFGIALGFGIFASVELVLVSVVMWYGNGHAAIISLLKSTAYNAVTVVWIGYLKQQPHLVPKVEAATNANTLGMALSASTALLDPDASFMLRVEQAVDRVLSRSDWPRPDAQGSRIVSRKPNPEESN